MSRAADLPDLRESRAADLRAHVDLASFALPDLASMVDVDLTVDAEEPKKKEPKVEEETAVAK